MFLLVESVFSSLTGKLLTRAVYLNKVTPTSYNRKWLENALIQIFFCRFSQNSVKSCATLGLETYLVSETLSLPNQAWLNLTNKNFSDHNHFIQ